MQSTGNLRVKGIRPLISPDLLVDEIPLSSNATSTVSIAREKIRNIIHGDDKRFLVVIGPCSIHDTEAALEYAQKLKTLADKHEDTLCIVMRVYFEKPRTTVGWKGLINDPNLDGSFDINQGLRVARQLLLDINALGVATGSEFLDTIIPQYISDLTSWSAIGARTAESQIHRELASGLSMPVGFKNGTTGSVKVALDAILAASHPHHFLGVTEQGVAAIVSTTGNDSCHVILRGATDGPNYDEATVDHTAEMLAHRQLQPKVMIDCSHGNSNKDFRRQSVVLDDICRQLNTGKQHIFGAMIESHLTEGNQSLNTDDALHYGQSITDACVGWEETETLIDTLSKTVKANT